VSTAGKIGEAAEATSGPLVLHLLGILHAYEGRYDEAEEAFLGAVEIEPEMVGSYVELGLVYACRSEYRRMAAALRQAVAIGPTGVRAYLGQRPLGDLPGDAAAGTNADGGDVASIGTAAAYIADGRDAEAAVMLEETLRDKPGGPPPAVALLALTRLLRGDHVEADEASVRRAPVAAEGQAGGR
jgi:tetratricopeptide (TPR) repeat protein